MIVYKLNQEQLDSLLNTQINECCYFNPIQDSSGNWVISQEEVDQSSIPWLKELPQIEFTPVPVTIGGFGE